MRKKKWSKGDLIKATATSTSVRQVLRKLGLIEAGGNYSQIKKYLNYYGIDYSHFKGNGWSKGLSGIGKPVVELEDILVRGSHYQSYKLKKRLFDAGIKQLRCEECGWAEISNDGRLPLELDHINGDNSDNRLENLRVLCPNCHSLKPSHRGCNRRKK